MANAYLKIDIETGKEKEVKTALKKINGVKSADFVTGAHDLVALVEGKNFEEINNSIASRYKKYSEAYADYPKAIEILSENFGKFKKS